MIDQKEKNKEEVELNKVKIALYERFMQHPFDCFGDCFITIRANRNESTGQIQFHLENVTARSFMEVKKNE